ncbi:glycoside hydrolase family 16 protein [Suillus discolor]|uniref:Glycoside hydrolase family 16 protein n=1 Tax=Suillus discolor TaxID=1912936 RepID=A0A9P7JS54_9AGAM|nr:glycoside hydrolase family 16 protein [Suillus discolor]KAG2103154.1 glycoside hydrolase family 16 protein [Suillus discolor]
MHSLPKLFLAAFSFTVLVDGSHHWYSHHYRTAAHRQLIGKTYMIQDFYRGEDFFKDVSPIYDWIFAIGSDPTGGNVIYQGQSDAQSKRLAYVDDCDNSFILAVDSTSTVAAGGQRASVRITSQKSYNGGLFIFDASYMPVGCSTWPSFWTVGPHWPMAGEIDIVEGVNNQGTNQMTLHTGTNQTCTNEITNSTHQFSGKIVATDCFSTTHADSGCSIEDTDTSSFAYGFNNAEGGVFALLWDNSAGMSIWHFARANIPADLIAQTPRPSTWGIPAGFWSSQTCDITTNFYEHQMVIDTTICGNWAGGRIYTQSGCPGTCSDMVANATNYVDAKWVINYVAVYQ